jgi:putative nucleotidyltransferase with HDIG domain
MALDKVRNLLSKPSWFKFDQKGWLKDFLIGFILVLSLGLFINSKEIHVDHLELNSTSNKYILAQTEFDFPDTAATRLLKEESIRDLGKIYYLQDTEILKVEKRIEDTLVERPFWRHELPTVSFDELIKASETLRDVLLKLRFSDQRTLTKLKQVGQFSKNFLIYSPSETSDIAEGSAEDLWEQIEQMAFLVRTPANQYILQQYQAHHWSLQEDLGNQHFLSRLIKDSIPLKMTKVLPGSRIINTGDKVTMRHIDMLKGMKKKLMSEHHFFNLSTLAGSLALALLMSLVAWLYLKTLYPHLVQSSAKKALVVTVVLFTLLIAKLTEFILLNKMGYLVDLCRFPVCVPLVILLLAILIDRKVAMIVSLFVTFVMAITLVVHYQHFFLINLAAALVSTILVKTVRKRKEIFEICAKIWLTTIPFILGVNLMENTAWDYHILIDMLTSLVSMTVIGVIVVAILPVFESVFGIVTDMTLLESADLSHPLLRRLNLEAPGTYRHSLSVAVLAEEAALAINANPIFCRVAALYHDIGKLAQPQYFTENQFCGFNMHQLLTPLESAQVIIAHVAEGVKLAEQYELPPSLIDVIHEHHGTGLVYYFYHAQIEQSRVKAIMVEECRFRYPGPTPRSRESAIIMISDSVEAAFRSLEEVTEKAVVELIESIVADKIREHQFDTSGLTFDELESIKKAMIRSLVSNGHSRVKYPEKPTTVVWKSEEIYLS